MNLKRLLSRYSVDQLKEAIRLHSQHGKVEALEAKRDEFQRQLARVERKLSRLTGSNGATSTGKRGRKPGRRKGYKLSAATREKMRQAALARHRKTKPEEAKPERKTRKLSAAGRAAISAAAKARWERVRQAKVESKT